MRSPSHPLSDDVRYGAVFVYELPWVEVASPVPGILAGALTPADAPALEEAMQASGEYPAGVAGRRFSPERHAYGVWADGLIVTYGWAAYTPEPIGGLGVSFRLEPGEVYIYDCATRPAYQGRGYYKALLRAMVADFRKQGYRRAWIGTEPGNIASQRGILGAGFTKVASINASRRAPGDLLPEVYGLPGVPEELVRHAAWSFSGEIIDVPDAI